MSVKVVIFAYTYIRLYVVASNQWEIKSGPTMFLFDWHTHFLFVSQESGFKSTSQQSSQ
jgi:hypothetical protein